MSYIIDEEMIGAAKSVIRAYRWWEDAKTSVAKNNRELNLRTIAKEFACLCNQKNSTNKKASEWLIQMKGALNENRLRSCR